MAGLQREYLLHLADNALVLGQRNAEWCGHGPIIEEDLALGNMSLDLIGQARLLYSHVAEASASGATEDTLAYLRDAPQFRNYTLVELPHRVMALPTSSGDRDFGLTTATWLAREANLPPNQCRGLPLADWATGHESIPVT